MTRQAAATSDAIARWEVQLRKGVLEFVILLSLAEREQYGFELISGIAKRASLEVPEGTLYPLMLRLAKDDLIASRLAEGEGGAPRKYYRLTPQGQAILAAMRPSWARLDASVQQMIDGVSA
jgi:PadR family transcriptional regulator PadR